MQEGYILSFTSFIQECSKNENTKITHAIYMSEDSVLNEYVRYPYKKDSLKLFFSMTKSFTSLAVGIALDLGLLHLDDYIAGFFPDELPPIPDKNLDKITVRHLLTMSCGIHENTYPELFAQDDWVKAFLGQSFPHEPGTYYRYSTHSSHMLSAIITKVSGLSLEQFLNIYLFYPMEIYEAQWELSPEKLTAGGMGLSLYPRSLVKIARMLLQDGVYKGRQFIAKEYLKMAATRQIIKQEERDRADCKYCGSGYGFQFHIGKDGYYRMDGAFGQLCLLCPDKKRAVIVFSQYARMEDLLSLVYKHLLNDTEGCGDISDNGRTPKKTISPKAAIPSGKFRLQENNQGIEAVEFIAAGDEYLLALHYPTCTDTIRFSLLHETRGTMNFRKDLQVHPQEYYCEAAFNNALTLNIFLIETPYVAVYHFTFGANTVQVTFSVNVSFTLQDFSVNGYLTVKKQEEK